MRIKFAHLLLLFCVLAFIIRFHNLGQASLWLDEILQVQCTSGPISTIWANHPANKPPTDYYIQWFFVRGNPDEVRIRLHACLIGTGVVAAMGLWGRAMGGYGLALIAMSLSLGLPVLVRFSQEARGYSLMLLAECLFFAALWRIARSQNRWKTSRWIFLIVSLALCIWSNYSAILACFWAAVFALNWWIIKYAFSRRASSAENTLSTPPLAISTRLILILCLFLTILSGLPAYFFMKADASSGYFAPWDVTDLPKRIALYLDIFALGYEWTQYVSGARWILLFLALIGLIAGQRQGHRAAANFCLFLFLGCFAGSFFLFWKMNHWMEMRYALTALPPLLMLAAMGLVSIGKMLSTSVTRMIPATPTSVYKLQAISFAIPTIILAAFLIAYTWTHPIKRLDWRGMAQYIKPRVKRGSVVITGSSQEKIPLQYYFNRFGVQTRIEASRHNIDKIRDLYYGNSDVWIIFAQDALPPQLRKSLKAVPKIKKTFWRIDVRRKPQRGADPRKRRADIPVRPASNSRCFTHSPTPSSRS